MIQEQEIALLSIHFSYAALHQAQTSAETRSREQQNPLLVSLFHGARRLMYVDALAYTELTQSHQIINENSVAAKREEFLSNIERIRV